MISYILKRLCWIGFIGMIILLVLSSFLPNYYYTHYHDVHIISSKNTIIKHCTHEDHKYNGKLIVWKGTDDNGNVHTIQSEVNIDDPDDTTEGVCYNDLKNGIAKTHNCTTAFFTIFGLILFGFISTFTFSTEDLNDYYYDDRTAIRRLRLSLFYIYMIFCGHDPKILYDLCEEEYNNVEYAYVIPKYTDLYKKYRNKLNKINKEKC